MNARRSIGLACCPSMRPLRSRLHGYVAKVGIILLIFRWALPGASGATNFTEAKVGLHEFLAQLANGKPSLGTNVSLDPQWVGTVRRAYLRGGEGVYREDIPTNIRFTHLMVVKRFEREPQLIMARPRRGNDGRLRYAGGEDPAFMKALPSVKAVSEVRNLDDLLGMFGPQHGWTDAWGSEERMHWSEGWTLFTVESKEKVRYLSVFAHVSGKKGQKPADIDILCISEGLFRPANPNSRTELDQFKAPEELFASEQQARKGAREVYPQPLRALVDARETPDDSDLTAYKRALNEIRSNPPIELFGQFAEWIHEGTIEIRMMLEMLLFDNLRLGLDRWDDQKRNVALRALNDALPRVKTSMDLDLLIVFLLQSQGGGELVLGIPGEDARIDLEYYGLEGGARYGSQNVTAENLRRVAEVCRDALRERYPSLR